AASAEAVAAARPIDKGVAAPGAVAVLERTETKVELKDVAFEKLLKSLEKASAATVTASRGEEGTLIDVSLAVALGTEEGDVCVLAGREVEAKKAALAKLLTSKSL